MKTNIANHGPYSWWQRLNIKCNALNHISNERHFQYRRPRNIKLQMDGWGSHPHSLPVPSSLLPLMGGGDTVSLQVIQPGKDLDATPGKN